LAPYGRVQLVASKLCSVKGLLWLASEREQEKIEIPTRQNLSTRRIKDIILDSLCSLCWFQLVNFFEQKITRIKIKGHTSIPLL
jgi:hypothetical protein